MPETDQAAAAPAAANGQSTSTTTDQPQANPEVEALRQRISQLEQERDSLKGRVRQSAVTIQALEELDERISKTVAKVAELSITDEDINTKRTKLKEHLAELESQKSFSKRVNAVQPKLMKLLEDQSLNLDDPKLKDVKTLWDNGEPEQAFAEARILLAGQSKGVSSEDIQKAVDAALQNERAKGRTVDTGAATAAGAITQPKTAAEALRYFDQQRAAGKPLSSQERARIMAGVPR